MRYLNGNVFEGLEFRIIGFKMYFLELGLEILLEVIGFSDFFKGVSRRIECRG